MTPKRISSAWSTWHDRHGGKLGPGPAFREAIESALQWHQLSYGHCEATNALLLVGEPFDGREYLMKTNVGVVSGHWFHGEWSDDTPVSPSEYNGWCWVCYDDAFQLELDEVTHWQEMIG